MHQLSLKSLMVFILQSFKNKHQWVQSLCLSATLFGGLVRYLSFIIDSDDKD